MTLGSVALLAGCAAQAEPLRTEPHDPLAAVGSASPVYVGCFQDSTKRLLGSRLTQTGASIDSCLRAASAAGLQYAGLEYGGECWGGNSLSSARELSDDECDMPCDAAPLEACGGAWTSSIYKLPASNPKPTEASTPKPTETSTPKPKPTSTETPSPTHDHTSTSTTQLRPDQFPVRDPGSSELRIGPSEQGVGVEQDGIGDFRTVCSYSHMNYDDPIVFPGKPGASHLHTYFGNSLANASTTDVSLANTGNSTCRGGIANRSAYWVPALLDAQGRPVAPIESNFYYKSGYNGIPAAQIKPFKTGLRMLAGSAKFSPSSGGTQAHAYWICEDYSAGLNHEAGIPDCAGNGGGHTIMYLDFPQCWDGVHLQTTDADPKVQTHVAYPENGKCPAGWVAIPHIEYKVEYDLAPGSKRDWRLASDMYEANQPGGYSVHGDYFGGWKQDVLNTFVKNCTSRAGVDCHSDLLGDGTSIY
ncbi:MAG: hypothetical protein RLZZ450_2546 [Pseudomonadota bacterium]|jgi:hypothetical protein